MVTVQPSGITPLVTEIRIYPDKNGKFNIPDEYRSDVVYGTNVKALSTVLYSEGVMSNDRIAAFLNAAGNGMKDLLCELNRERKKLADIGESSFPEETLYDYEKSQEPPEDGRRISQKQRA